ncbi:MAG: Sua5/YciO/YrdC/YwlC family protein, partial [Rikenellaceae bacterium]
SVGIRVPKCNIALRIVEELGVPLVSTTIPHGNLAPEDYGQPELLWEEFGDMVDVFVDAGELWGELTTVVDFTGDEPIIIREGDYKL